MTEQAKTLWTVEQIAAYLGVKPSSARGQLTRWGLTRAPQTGTSQAGRITALYYADEVRAKHENRPGQGVRPTNADAGHVASP